MPRKSKTVLVVRKGRLVSISRQVYEYSQRKKRERIAKARSTNVEGN